MKVDELLQELGGNNPIPALEKFNAYVEESSNAQGIINGLVLASDSCSEILNLLTTEKHTSSEVAAIFSTLSHVLINIAGELREHISIGLHITRQLLHNHESHIYRFLLPTNTNKNTKAVLRCITGMVLLGGEAANEVLVSLNWSQINISLIANRQSVKDVWDVRAWCIYMMLAFLNSTEEPHIIQQFLLKKDVLPAIFPGLIWDPCERVINVLKVMHESILLNPSVSKTAKVQLFTPTTTKPLLDLYKWSGPMGKFTKSENIEELENEVANTVSDERTQIRKVLHKFMLTLCTSYKHGIVFREKEQKGQIQSNNWYVYSILSHMKTPWQTSECSELMSKVLGVCPDLLKTYFPTLKTLLKPRPKKSFISIIDMISQTIACQAPWKKMETRGVSGVLACLVPNPLNQNLFKSLLESPYGQVRHCGMMLSYAILTKAKETCESIKQSHTLSVAVKEDMRRKLIASVFSVLMPVSAIAHCWNLAAGVEFVEKNFEENLGDADAAETVSVTSQLLSIAKTLTMYAELLPSQTVFKAIKPVEMLQNVRDHPDDEVGSSKVKFELQVLCLGFLADSKISQDCVVDTPLTEESMEHMEKNVLYQLISTYAESKQHSSENGDATLMLSVTETCQSNLSSALAKTGLAAHYDGNIKFWLRHILKNNIVKLSSFLTRVIQKTVASLSQYTDMLVEIGSKATLDLNSSTIVETESVLTAIETLEIVDNEDVSQHAVSLPFSRLVFGALELLHSNPDPDYVDYFSSVMNDYLYSLSDPGILVDMLLKEESVISSDLKAYLRCWVKKKHKQSKDNVQLSDGVGLSDIFRYLFMTHDWATVEKLLEGSKLLNVLDKADLDLVITQLLIYLCLQLNSEKTGMKELSLEKKGAKMVKKYTHLLRRLYETLSEDNDKKYAECVLQMVLEHPRILASYQPFCNKRSPVTELTEEFIDLALRKHCIFAPNTYPYFKILVQNLQNPSSRRDGIDVYSPFAPFLSSKDTVVSYEDLQNLFMICLEALCLHQPSHSTLILELIQLIQKTTSAKRVLSSQSVQFAFAKFLEFGSSAEEKNPQFEKIMYDFEKLLIQVMDSGKCEQLSPEDMKNLMQCQPPCAILCCHLVKQHPPHARTLSRYFKKHQPSLPAQAPLLSRLLDQEESASAAGSTFTKLTETLRTWIVTFEDEDDATRLLIPHALEKSILDVDCLGEVCQRLYKETVTAELLPPKKILTLLPLFQKLADVEPDLSKFGLPGLHIALLQICLSCIRKTYKEKQENLQLLMELAKVISEILPKLDGDSLRRNLSNSKLWSSFVKQVLRRGLGDVVVGPDLVNQLRDLCSVIYRKRRGGDKEEALPTTTLYSMIMGHTQYLSLMFNRDADWEKLKEAVVRLQLSVVECQPEVCQDAHVPVLLGAYTASMSAVDQCILMLLHRYEKEGHMSTLHPVLWGDVAIAHFGVGSQMPGFFREPTLEQILGLLDMTRLSLTCRSFDIWLPLEPTEIHAADKSLYDVRFLLPLMLYLGREKTTLSEIDYAECGAVQLGFTALTSQHREVWSMGAALLRCLVQKMEKSSHRRLKLPWQWLVAVVSCAMEGRQRRLPALTIHFLVEASRLLSQPSHPMYQPVLNYLFLLPAFRIYFVPELYEFFSSSHVTSHREHRSFLLSNLSQGIKHVIDYKICQRSFTSTLMMGMLQAPTADIELKVQVLEVLEAMVHIHLGAVELVRNYNLLTVLPLVALPVNSAPALRPSPITRPGHPLLMAGVVQVLATLWATLMDTITRKTSMTSPEDEALQPEEEEENKSGKRKRRSSDTYSKSFKKSRKESSEDSTYKAPVERNTSTFGVEVMDATEESRYASEKPRSKMLPPLFVHEYLNCLKILTPSILAGAPVAVSSKLIYTLAEVVQYVDVMALLAMDRLKLRLIALTPQVVKQQVYDIINWDMLHQQLLEHLSDDEEVLVLGEKAKDSVQQWRNEPLSIHLNKQQQLQWSHDQAEDADIEAIKECDFLKKTVVRLLKVLGK